LTDQLKLKNIDRAIDQASQEVVDWSGGTRIGESLRTFNRQWGRRVVRRGAVVIVVSDGWERGDVSVLRQEMRFLQKRCHRLIWLNPLLGDKNYQPLVEGMAAALPYIDDFLPIHNLQSLKALSDHLMRLGPKRSSRPAIK
ncbi:MAG: VWA domain-containing protein, partial [Anaerolineales bacterium]